MRSTNYTTEKAQRERPSADAPLMQPTQITGPNEDYSARLVEVRPVTYPFSLTTTPVSSRKRSPSSPSILITASLPHYPDSLLGRALKPFAKRPQQRTCADPDTWMPPPSFSPETFRDYIEAASGLRARGRCAISAVRRRPRRSHCRTPHRVAPARRAQAQR